MTKSARNDELLNPDAAVEELASYGLHVTADAIRIKVRRGLLPFYHKARLAGRVFVKRGELLASYAKRYKRVREGVKAEK